MTNVDTQFFQVPNSHPIPCQNGTWLFGLLIRWWRRRGCSDSCRSSGSLLITAEELSWVALWAGPCSGVMSHLFGVILSLALCPLSEMICLQWSFHLNPRPCYFCGTFKTSMLPQQGLGRFCVSSFPGLECHDLCFRFMYVAGLLLSFPLYDFFTSLKNGLG